MVSNTVQLKMRWTGAGTAWSPLSVSVPIKTQLVLICTCFLLGIGSASSQIAAPAFPVSTTQLNVVSGGGHSFPPAFSADGRFLVFLSQANNLVTNDDNAVWSDVFVRDLTTGATTLVSVGTNGITGGNGNSYEATVSSNGQFIVFQSVAGNLVSGDNNGLVDVFVRDMVAGTTRLVSVNPGGTLAGNGRSLNPRITPDGRWVAFESQASNLVGGDVNGNQDVFVRDLQTSTTYLVSVGALGSARKSGSATLSDDGLRVAFESDAQFFSSNLTYSAGEVYVRDRQANVTIWASSNTYALSAAAHTTYRAFSPVLSSDGRSLAFKTAPSPSPTPLGASLYFFDLQTKQLVLVSTNTSDATAPELTPDGRWLAFEGGTNVYLWNSVTGSNVLVSVDVTGTSPASGTSTRPIASAGGARVLFLSDATNLTSNGAAVKTQLYLRDLALGVTELVSGRPDGTTGADLGAIRADLSRDGNYAAFESEDERLVPDDNNQASDVFLRDLRGGATELISSRLVVLPTATCPGHAAVGKSSLSADGRWAVFTAFDATLVAGDRNGQDDAFLVDLATGSHEALSAIDGAGPMTNVITFNPVITANSSFAAYLKRDLSSNPPLDQLYACDLVSRTTTLVTQNWTNHVTASGSSRHQSFSRDGSKMTFESDAPDLIPGDNNGSSDVFFWDSAQGSNVLVSINAAGTGAGNLPSANPVISHDGRWIVFESQASDLVSNPVVPAGPARMFARDLVQNRTTMISVDNLGNWFSASNAVMSADSKTVLFSGSGNNIYAYDLYAGTNTLVCTGCQNPSTSGDAHWVAFESLGGSGIRDVVLADLQTGTTILVSTNRNGTGGGNAPSFSPQITFDGQYVVFLSRASNLVGGAANFWAQALVWDRVLNQTIIGSMSLTGNNAANGPSFNLVLGADGRSVLFQSYASDLITRDFNNDQSVFALRLSTGDSDSDGVDDDWEWAYFGSLARNGGADFDGDGHTDYQEFLAGTDPTNPRSSLRIITLEGLSGSRTLLWSSVPGKSYIVQYKDDLLAGNWADLDGTVTATGSTASKVDDTAPSGVKRFYRLRLVP